MKHSSYPSRNLLVPIFGFVLFGVALFAFGITPAAHAQRGGMGGHASGGRGGGHFVGGGHVGGGHRVGGAHVVQGQRGGRAVARMRTSAYLTYSRDYGAGQPMRRGSFQPLFYDRSRIPGRSSYFGRRFHNFRNGLYPYDLGFWGWGGDWGWDSGWWNDCDPNEGDCQDYGRGYPESRDESAYEQPGESRPSILVYLRDGTGYAALDYWLTNGVLHIETSYGTEKSFPLADVDVQRTFTENTARGVTFTLSPYPMASDPGPMFAPDSYAPECVSPSAASHATTSTSVPAASGNSTSWFGANGSTSDQGLAVGSVRSDSPAAQIGVRPGDIVVRVNCQQVHTAQEIESAVNNTTGPVWVSYMIRGAWLTDKKITR